MAQSIRHRRALRNFVAKHDRHRGGPHGKTKKAQRQADKRQLEAGRKDDFARYSRRCSGSGDELTTHRAH